MAVPVARPAAVAPAVLGRQAASLAVESTAPVVKLGPDLLEESFVLFEHPEGSGAQVG